MGFGSSLRAFGTMVWAGGWLQVCHMLGKGYHQRRLARAVVQPCPVAVSTPANICREHYDNFLYVLFSFSLLRFNQKCFIYKKNGVA